MAQSGTDSGTEVHIQRDSKRDRWKWACPAGHTNWDRTNGGIWCTSCSRAHDIEDPHWKELVNKATGETVSWENVVFE